MASKSKNPNTHTFFSFSYSGRVGGCAIRPEKRTKSHLVSTGYGKPYAYRSFAIAKSVKKRQKTSAFSLVWPSGAGDEIGFVRTNLSDALRSIEENRSVLGRPIRVTKVQEDGAVALVIDGLPGSPVTLVSEPEHEEVLGIVADEMADQNLVRGAVSILLPTFGLTFYANKPAQSSGDTSQGLNAFS